MNIGEWICFDNMGAYTCAAASKFNGFRPASIMYMCRRNFWDVMEYSKEFYDNKVVSDKAAKKKLVTRMERFSFVTAHGLN